MSREHHFIIFVSVISVIAGFLFGFDTGVIAGALKPILETFDISEANYQMQEWIVSSVPLGALVGAIASSFFADKLGRHDSIILSAVLFVLGTLAIMFSEEVTWVLFGRATLGLSVGLSAMIVPMYLSEVAPETIRGRVIFTFQLAITLGILTAYLVNYAFSSSGNWRAMFGVGLLPSVALGLGMLVLPRSPRWLVLKGRYDEALDSLRLIRPGQGQEALEAIIKNCQLTPEVKLKDLFTKEMLPLLGIAFGLFAVQQLCGINTIFYYGPKLFEEAGIGANDVQLYGAMLCGLVNVLATCLGVYLIDKIGRRLLLFVGMIGVSLSLFLLSLGYHGILFVEHFPFIALGLVLSMITFFAISLGGVPFVLMSEIFPLKVRHWSMAFASSANWGFNLLVSSTFLTGIQQVGIGNMYLLYSVITFFGFLFAYVYVPETKCQTLEHIEAELTTSAA